MLADLGEISSLCVCLLKSVKPASDFGPRQMAILARSQLLSFWARAAIPFPDPRKLVRGLLGHFPTFPNWTFKRLIVASEGHWRSFWELDPDHLSRVSRGNDLGQFCGYTPLKAKIAKSRHPLEGDGCLQKLSCRTSWQISARSPRSVSVHSNRLNQRWIWGISNWQKRPDLDLGQFWARAAIPCQTRENWSEAL